MKNWLLVIGFLASTCVSAQQHHHAGGKTGAAQQHSDYVGLQQRDIKALSAQQVIGLRAGKGMGAALAAELNGYPGPLHVLELAETINLSREQRTQIQVLFERMQTEARALGEKLIASETKLDRLFKDQRASPATLRHATAEAAQLQGELRFTHLKYHLNMVEVLTSEQVAHYKVLRGYE